MSANLNGNARRYPRYQLDLTARAIADGEGHPAVVQDISEGGASIAVDNALFTNDEFVELQVEGHSNLSGRVVRQFQGGYAMEFDEDTAEKRKLAEEIEKFRAIAGKKAYLEG